MSEKNFNWCMIHWKGRWRVYRDKSAFPWGLPVTCANTCEQAIRQLERYLEDDCPSFVIMYEHKIRSTNAYDAHKEFISGNISEDCRSKSFLEKVREWFGRW